MKRSIVVGLMVGGALLAGCGSADPPPVQHPSTESTSSVAAETPAPEPEPAPVAEAGTRENPLPIGGTAQVGNDWEVTVNEVILNANEIVAGDNEFNEPPNGQYVMIQLTATFLGAEQTESNPGMDLMAVIVGSDARQYTDFDHTVVVDGQLMDAPVLEPGGTATGSFTVDVPPEALTGAHLFIDATMAMDDEARRYWAL